MLRLLISRVAAILNGINWATISKCVQIVKDVATMFPGPQTKLDQAQQDALNAKRRAEALAIGRTWFPNLPDSVLEWAILTALRLVKKGKVK